MIDNIGSVRVSLVTYVVPVVAVVLGWLVLDESIGLNTMAGGLLIVAGVASVMRGQAPARQIRREPVGATAAAD
jgi:drug/metabolite transporter (DMT)-like permease